MASFSIKEIPAQLTNSNIYDNITFVVSDLGVVFFTKEYTQHVIVAKRANVPNSQIAWGGIVNSDGKWIRMSFDFGDAPTIEIRELVVSLIKKSI